MRSNVVIADFFQEIAKRLGASPPDPLNDAFELQYTSLLNTYSNLDILTF